MSASVIRGNRVLLDGQSRPSPATLHIENGKIAKIELGNLKVSGSVDAGDLVVFPGIVETHAHLNEPGRTEWEGFRSGTRAAAAGGITTIVDMPLNSIPATTSVSALKTKAASADGACQIDYGFWGGVIPGNSGELEAMVKAGVPGFKAFMIESGVDEFPCSSESDLREAMTVLARSKTPLLLHAEVECSSVKLSGASNDYSRYVRSRPPEWEVEAIRRAIALSKETRCATHIVHLSAADALPEIEKAKRAGVSLTVETCPHYLTFLEEEIPAGATHFKCAPPIRDRRNQERLWEAVKSGLIDLIVSDHSPCTPELKKMEKGDFDEAWGGIAGLQLSLPAAWSGMRKRGLGLGDLARAMCEKPAGLAGFADRKGRIRVGFDADLVFWDPEREFEVMVDRIHHRHRLTPYAGKKFFGAVSSTWVRGHRVYYEREGFSERGEGKWIKRQ